MKMSISIITKIVDGMDDGIDDLLHLQQRMPLMVPLLMKIYGYINGIPGIHNYLPTSKPDPGWQVKMTQLHFLK